MPVMYAYILGEQPRMMGEGRGEPWAMGELPGLSMPMEGAAAMSHARTWRRIMRRVATHRRLQREGGARGKALSRMFHNSPIGLMIFTNKKP